MGTCNYVLAQPCRHKPREIAFVVSATNENRGGNMEVSYVRAVHLRVFDLKISLVKGRKVMVRASLSPGLIALSHSWPTHPS